MKNQKIFNMVKYALFIAILAVLGFTPLGLIMMPSAAAITTLHIPVIIGAVLFGVGGGAILGFSFGVITLIRCFGTPDVIASIVLGTAAGTGFGLINLLMVIFVLIVPRILVGVVAALVYRGLSRFDKTSTWSVAVASVAASLTNSVLVLGTLTLMAYEQVASVVGATGAGAVVGALVALNALNVVLEAVLAAVLCTAVCKALLVYMKKHNPNRVG